MGKGRVRRHAVTTSILGFDMRRHRGWLFGMPVSYFFGGGSGHCQRLWPPFVAFFARKAVHKD